MIVTQANYDRPILSQSDMTELHTEMIQPELKGTSKFSLISTIEKCG
uniref:Uncharacterized protein n=1 Tax=Arundo donax TaxID=35708 RepID=A0A0A9BLC9_ARUDO